MREVINFINNLNISNDEYVVLACSYGPDSMCLLDLLRKCELKVVVAHVNHQIREEAQSETEYVEEYCKHKKIRCFTKYVNIPQVALEQRIGTEEAGRNERRRIFDQHRPWKACGRKGTNQSTADWQIGRRSIGCFRP